MNDWTVQSIAVLIGGFTAMIGLWALFLWSLGNEDRKK